MATAKKTTATKKTTARKPAAAAKRATPKKTATKRPAAKRVVAKKRTSSKTPNYETFKLSSDVPPITSFKVTRQTVYWVIIMAFIIFFQLWIIKLQVEVAQLIQTNQTQIIEDL